MDLQSLFALLIVLLTFGIVLVKIITKKVNLCDGCDGCSKKTPSCCMKLDEYKKKTVNSVETRI